VPKTAFLVIKSPQELDPTHMVRRFAVKAESSMILAEDGVFQAIVAPAAEKLKQVVDEVLVLKDDLEARGFSQSDLKIGTAVDYPEVVDLIMERTERAMTV